MRVLAMAKEEIILLSLIYGKPYNALSVMKQLNTFDKMEDIVSKEDYVKITNGFLRNKLIGFDHEKKIRPTSETILLFDTINAPHKTFVLHNQLKSDVGDIYYCEKNGFGVLITVSPGEAFCAVNYPFDREMLVNWLDQEVIGDLGVERTDFAHMTFEVSEIAHLYFMTMVAFTGFLRTLPKHDPDLRFELGAMENPAFIKRFEDFKQLIDPGKLQGLFSRPDAQVYLDELKGAGLVLFKDGRCRINPYVAKYFDVNQFRGIVRMDEYNPFARGKTLYATNHGYLFMEEVKFAPVTMKMDIVPLSLDKKLFEEMFFSFSDLRLTTEMKTKLEAKLQPST